MHQLELAGERLLSRSDSLVDVGRDCVANRQKAESCHPSPHLDLPSKQLAGGQKAVFKMWPEKNTCRKEAGYDGKRKE